MTAYIILGAFIGLPLILGLSFRVSVSHLFVSLLAGELLERYFNDDVQLVLSPLLHNEALLAYTGLIVLFLPVFLTALFLRHTLSKGKAAIQIIPYLLTGIIFAAFALQLMPPVLLIQVQSTEVGQSLYRSTEVIIGGTVFLQLIALWLLNRHGKSNGHKGKSH